MRDCTDPHIVQYYGAFLESVSASTASSSLCPMELTLLLVDSQNNTQIGICMEFCEAGSLDSLYKKVKSKGWRTGEKVLGKIADSVSHPSPTSNSPRPFRSSFWIREQILSGLVYLHDHKIIHRGVSALAVFFVACSD